MAKKKKKNNYYSNRLKPKDHVDRHINDSTLVRSIEINKDNVADYWLYTELVNEEAAMHEDFEQAALDLRRDFSYNTSTSKTFGELWDKTVKDYNAYGYIKCTGIGVALNDDASTTLKVKVRGDNVNYYLDEDWIRYEMIESEKRLRKEARERRKQLETKEG